FYSVIDADVVTADERLVDDEPFRKSGPLLGRVRRQRHLRSRLNTVSTKSVLCWAALCSRRRQKRKRCCTFGVSSPQSTPAKWSPRAVFSIFRMTSPYLASLFPIHKQALEITTSNDATSRGTKRRCTRRLTCRELPVQTE